MKEDQKIKLIEKLIEKSKEIQIHRLSDSTFISWRDLCERTLVNIFGINSKVVEQFNKLDFSYHVGIWVSGRDYSQEYLFCFDRDLNVAVKMFQLLIDEISKMDDTTDGNKLIKLLNIIDNKFRRFFRTEPKNEKDVQNQFENLLIASDLLYTREKEHILYSSKTYIPDFVISELNMALEIKLCNRADREKEIIAEINDDILAYNTQFENIMFLIYDIGQIRDTEMFKSSFSKFENVFIVIIKH
jgi:hypothetical protein